MDEKLLDYMERMMSDAMDVNLTLFVEYHRLSELCKAEGNTDAHQYWRLRSLEVSNSARKLRNDIRQLEKDVKNNG